MTQEEFDALKDRVSFLERTTKKVNNNEPCLWEPMPETSPGSGVKMGRFSCPCPKCYPNITER